MMNEPRSKPGNPAVSAVRHLSVPSSVKQLMPFDFSFELLFTYRKSLYTIGW